MAEIPNEDTSGDPIGPFTNTESKWAVRVDVTANGIPGPHILNCGDSETAAIRLRWWLEKRPDANPVLMRRERTITYSAWAEDDRD